MWSAGLPAEGKWSGLKDWYRKLVRIGGLLEVRRRTLAVEKHEIILKTTYIFTFQLLIKRWS